MPPPPSPPPVETRRRRRRHYEIDRDSNSENSWNESDDDEEDVDEDAEAEEDSDDFTRRGGLWYAEDDRGERDYGTGWIAKFTAKRVAAQDANGAKRELFEYLDSPLEVDTNPPPGLDILKWWAVSNLRSPHFGTLTTNSTFSDQVGKVPYLLPHRP